MKYEAGTYRRKTCVHCPFRRDVRPYLHPDRAEEIAFLSQNPYSEFHCHETIKYDDDGDGYVTHKSLLCAGFVAMQVNYCMDEPDGWEWPGDVYCEPEEMVDACREEWAK